MNRNAAFNRKVAYSICIVLLLLVIARIGQPESSSNKGGVLAEMRREHGLSQAELGAIDPAGETMKLATLGMRGVAANLLWGQAVHYKKTENWDSLSATLNQITKLQPNFVKVWDYQAHNLAYNISAQFDDYRHRYHWVKKGITFLLTGAKYNRKEPRLLVFAGRYFGQKIGRSDETKQFRRLFAKDHDFHRSFSEYVNVDDAIGQSNDPDNWLVGRLFFIKAEKLVQTEGVPIRGDSPLLFYANTPKARMNYCMANEKDGYHGGRAVQNWREALAEWIEYGSRDIPTSFGHNLRLNDEEEVVRRVSLLREEFQKLSGGLQEKIQQERQNSLSQEEAEALAKHPVERLPQEHAAAMRGQQKLQVSLQDVVKRLPEDVREKGELIAAKISDLEKLQQRINSYRSIVNFNYWKTRCEVESLENTDLARRLVYDADQALRKDSNLILAKKNYDLAFDRWYEVFKEFPELMTDDMAEDLMKSISSYQTLLDQLGEEFPQDFVLHKLVTVQESFSPGVPSEPEATEPETQPDGETSNKQEAPKETGEKAKDVPEEPAAEKPAADKETPKPAEKEAAKPDEATAGEDDKSADAAAEKSAEPDDAEN